MSNELEHGKSKTCVVSPCFTHFSNDFQWFPTCWVQRCIFSSNVLHQMSKVDLVGFVCIVAQAHMAVEASRVDHRVFPSLGSWPSCDRSLAKAHSVNEASCGSILTKTSRCRRISTKPWGSCNRCLAIAQVVDATAAGCAMPVTCASKKILLTVPLVPHKAVAEVSKKEVSGNEDRNLVPCSAWQLPSFAKSGTAEGRLLCVGVRQGGSTTVGHLHLQSVPKPKPVLGWKKWILEETSTAMMLWLCR